MKLKKITLPYIIIFILLGVCACDDDADNKSVDALIVIVGRHANANVFHKKYYEPIEKYIKGTVYGGYIGVISSEGTPRVLEDFDYFKANEQNGNKRKKQIDENTEFVIGFLENEKSTQAKTPENDPLRAIQEAIKLFNGFEERAKSAGKSIKEKRIVIMETGVATTGALDFSTHNIDNFDFSVLDGENVEKSNERIQEFASEIAERLSVNRALPNLSGINIVFIGLGDVAKPQKELSNHIQNGLKILWTTILNKANAKNIEILELNSSYEANDTSKFEKVKPIEFLESTGWTISNEQITFNFGEWVYKNSNEAENNLRRFADIITRYMNRKPNTKIYVVGSESKNDDREYTTILSEKRAKTVMETLAKFGVPKNKMEVFGVAVYLPNRENDRPNNVFDPVKGEKNQKVVLIPNDIRNQTYLKEVLATRDKLYGRR